jgi:hypothetical protein
MDMPMTICVQIVFAVETPNCRTMVRPIVDADGAANDVGIETELRSEPIRCDDSVGIRTGDPARAAPMTRAAPIARAAPTRPAVEISIAMPRSNAISAERAARIEYYHDQYLLRQAEGSSRTNHCIEAGSQ